jgi:N6-L-threonylcarbamoyladenine synthase
MYHLAFETSCDDTSIAVMQDDRVIVLITRSQIAEHADTRGVVPEVAARLHANVVFEVLDEVLAAAKITLNDLSFMSVTAEPGLMPSLLVGKTVAKTLAHLLNIPLLLIHHIEGHMFANLLDRSIDDLVFPAVVLTVSWGHNELYLWRSLYSWELLGETRDDAGGEAFDKVAKALGLGFPWGPILDRLAREYTENADILSIRGARDFLFPVPLLETTSLDFSFSGLKSAVKREIDQRISSGRWVENTPALTGILSIADIREISYEFQKSMVEVFAIKLARAVEQIGVSSVMLAGWVSANDALRDRIASDATKNGWQFIAPARKVYSMDNAAMIGVRAWYEYLRLQ